MIRLPILFTNHVFIFETTSRPPSTALTISEAASGSFVAELAMAKAAFVKTLDFFGTVFEALA